MFEGIATYIVGFFGLLGLIIATSWRAAWVASKQDSRLTVVEKEQTNIRKDVQDIHAMATQMALVNQSLSNLNREVKDIKTDIRSINTTLQNDKETHLGCPHYPRK